MLAAVPKQDDKQMVSEDTVENASMVVHVDVADIFTAGGPPCGGVFGNEIQFIP